MSLGHGLDQWLAEVQARCDAATPGPWEEDDVSAYRVNAESTGDAVATTVPQSDLGPLAANINRRFVAHARTDLPRALRIIARLRDVVENLEWVIHPEREWAYCPSCQQTERHGHETSCELVAALAYDGRE